MPKPNLTAAEVDKLSREAQAQADAESWESEMEGLGYRDSARILAQAIREGCHVLAAAIRELALAQYGVQATDSHGREVHPSHRWNGAVCIFCSGWAGDADALEPCGARKQE